MIWLITFFVICSLEFSYSSGSGPYTTLNTCDSGKFILNDFSAWLVILKTFSLQFKEYS